MPDTEPNFNDSLSKYVARIEEAEAKYEELLKTKKIITSNDFSIAPLTRDENIERTQIPWRLYERPMCYVITVKPKTEVPEHAHDEDVFRFVVNGQLVINDIFVKEGMWFVVRAKTPYRITTEDGYMVLAWYRMACIAPDR